MLRNCVADPDDDSIDVSNVVHRRYDPSYYTIYLEETSEYKLHENEHGKEYVWCVAVLNRWGIFFKIRLFKVHDMYSLDLDEFSVVDVHDSALYCSKSDLLVKIDLLYLGRLLHSRWNDEKKSWYVTWLAPSNECDIYETWGQFGSSYAQALEMCSCLKRFGYQGMIQLQYDVGRPNGGGYISLSFVLVQEFAEQFASRQGDEFRSRCWGNRSCLAYGKVLMYVMIIITWCCIAMVLKHEPEKLLEAFGQGDQKFKNDEDKAIFEGGRVDRDLASPYSVPGSPITPSSPFHQDSREEPQP